MAKLSSSARQKMLEQTQAEVRRLTECWDTEQQAHKETYAEVERLRAALDKLRWADPGGIAAVLDRHKRYEGQE